MKALKYIIPGVLFGIVMTKSEAVSWFRIQEMFRFESFHMYGIIGVAVILGAILTFLLKNFNTKSFDGGGINFSPKSRSISRYLLGGIIYGHYFLIFSKSIINLFHDIGLQVNILFMNISNN